MPPRTIDHPADDLSDHRRQLGDQSPSCAAPPVMIILFSDTVRAAKCSDSRRKYAAPRPAYQRQDTLASKEADVEVATGLAAFPAELLVTIFRALPRADLLAAEAVCTRWRSIVHRWVWPVQKAVTFDASDDRAYVQAYLASDRARLLCDLRVDARVHALDTVLTVASRLRSFLRRVTVERFDARQRNAILDQIHRRMMIK